MKRKQEAERAEQYVVHTSQEVDVLARATASGKTLRDYQDVEPAYGANIAIRFSQPAIPHAVEVRLTEDEQIVGASAETLTKHLKALIREQDSDAVLAQLYILSVLAPPPPAPARGEYSGWIDFDDVIEKIGWSPRSFAERRAMHLKISKYLRFGERAQIIGERSVPYVDKKTKTTMDTYVRHSIWRVLAERAPEQSSLQGLSSEADRAPVAAEVVISQRVAELLTSPVTAQYLPMGEVLGRIRGNQASGAWARVIGLALMSFWRRHPEHSLTGQYKPTRRDLLTRYPPKVATPEEILDGNDPRRALKYWHGALKALVRCGVLVPDGEAVKPLSALNAETRGYLWQERWLDTPVDLWPGEELRNHIENRHQLKTAGKPLKTAGNSRITAGK